MNDNEWFAYLGGRRRGALKQESSRISLLALADIVAAVSVPFFSSPTHTDDCSFSFIPSILNSWLATATVAVAVAYDDHNHDHDDSGIIQPKH